MGWEEEYWTNDEVAFSCKACEYVGSSESDLYQHKAHHMERGLSTHVVQIHGKDSGGVKCEKCPFIAKSRRRLTIHLRLDHNISPEIDCSDCDYVAKSTRDLTSHALDIHQNVLKIQGWAKEWALGCVNSPPAPRGSQEAGFTQPRAHSFAHPCKQEPTSEQKIKSKLSCER